MTDVDRGTEMRPWPGAIGAVTLFVEDLDAAKRFYMEVFALPVFFEEDDSAVLTSVTRSSIS